LDNENILSNEGRAAHFLLEAFNSIFHPKKLQNQVGGET